MQLDQLNLTQTKPSTTTNAHEVGAAVAAARKAAAASAPAPSPPGLVNRVDALVGVGNLPADLRWNFGDLGGGAGQSRAYAGLEDDLTKGGSLGKSTGWLVDLHSVAIGGTVAVPYAGTLHSTLLGTNLFAGVSHAFGAATLTVGGGENLVHERLGSASATVATPYLDFDAQGKAGPLNLDTEVFVPLDGSGANGIMARSKASLAAHPDFPTVEATYGKHGVSNVALDKSWQLSKDLKLAAQIGVDGLSTPAHHVSAGLSLSYSF